MRKPILIALLISALILLPSGSGYDQPTRNAVVVPVTITPRGASLNMTILSVTINGCSQTAFVNTTWTGTGYYIIYPSSFSLIIRTRNAVYSNSTDISIANNTVDQWYLFRNLPITLAIGFEACTSINSETLVYTDGTFLFILH